MTGREQADKCAELQEELKTLKAFLKKITAVNVDKIARENPKLDNAQAYASAFGACQGLALAALDMCAD